MKRDAADRAMRGRSFRAWCATLPSNSATTSNWRCPGRPELDRQSRSQQGSAPRLVAQLRRSRAESSEGALRAPASPAAPFVFRLSRGRPHHHLHRRHRPRPRHTNASRQGDRQRHRHRTSIERDVGIADHKVISRGIFTAARVSSVPAAASAWIGAHQLRSVRGTIDVTSVKGEGASVSARFLRPRLRLCSESSRPPRAVRDPRRSRLSNWCGAGPFDSRIERIKVPGLPLRKQVLPRLHLKSCSLDDR